MFEFLKTETYKDWNSLYCDSNINRPSWGHLIKKRSWLSDYVFACQGDRGPIVLPSLLCQPDTC